MSDDLITFLRARLNEDYQAAGPLPVRRDVDAKRRILDAYRLARKRQTADRRNYARWVDGTPERAYPVLTQDGPGQEEDIPGLELGESTTSVTRHAPTST